MASTTKFFVGDFETTVWGTKEQESTEVWASGCMELYTDKPYIFNSIDKQFNFFKSLKCNIICYYHNLKFDGNFWLYHLLVNENYGQAFEKTDETITPLRRKDMKNNTFNYLISDMGQWYKILIKTGGHYIELRDSYKLLPFKLDTIGKSFKTQHQKLEMEYVGFRYAGCEITDEERKYLENDLYVLKEALEIMFDQGHKKLTIGSCCLQEYKNLVGTFDYQDNFPQLYDINIDEEKYGSATAGAWIRNSYRGGWCYVVEGKEKTIYKNGTTLDVNSLYPSMMSSESGNKYPTGLPTFWSGNYIPDEAKQIDKYFFIRIRTKFKIKDGYLPFIQIKNTLLYKPTQMLKTSDVWDRKTKQYYDKYIDLNGEIKDAYVTLTLTMVDYYLILEHYHLIDCTILDGCYFNASIGIFDSYINKYKKLKLESTGALRELAKLFLNNLYGKMASSPDSDFKVATVKEDGSIGFITVMANDKMPGYIPVGSAITSYARNFTIRAAQSNYYGPKKRGFIYADTDSIHCDLPLEQIKGVKLHDKNFCCWKTESIWSEGFFCRQKTYIENVIGDSKGMFDKPQYLIKCAGMPDNCKNLLARSFDEHPLTEEELAKYNDEELEFLKTHRTITDFTIGLKIPGKLIPKRIPGGVLLVPTTYELK